MIKKLSKTQNVEIGGKEGILKDLEKLKRDGDENQQPKKPRSKTKEKSQDKRFTLSKYQYKKRADGFNSQLFKHK